MILDENLKRKYFINSYSDFDTHSINIGHTGLDYKLSLIHAIPLSGPTVYTQLDFFIFSHFVLYFV